MLCATAPSAGRAASGCLCPVSPPLRGCHVWVSTGWRTPRRSTLNRAQRQLAERRERACIGGLRSTTGPLLQFRRDQAATASTPDTALPPTEIRRCLALSASGTLNVSTPAS